MFNRRLCMFIAAGTLVSSHAMAEDAKTIALLLPNTAAVRFDKIDGPQFAKEVKSLCPTCKVIISNAQGDASRQQSQAEAALAQGAAVLVIDPFDGGAMRNVVVTAKSKNIPVINYDSLISDAPISYFVSFDSNQVGQQIAQSLVDRMKQLGTSDKCVVAIRGDASDKNQGAFWGGSLPVFQKAGTKLCYDVSTPGWSSSTAQTSMDQAITKIGVANIGGVYAMADELSAGVVASFVNAGAKSFPPITGQNGDLAALQQILAGRMYMTVWKNSITLAQLAGQMAVSIVQGKTPATATTIDSGGERIPANLVKTVVITRDNIKDTVVKAKYVDVAALCKGDYANDCKSLGITP
jgi:D-xylose transport system substrate-binding protein